MKEKKYSKWFYVRWFLIRAGMILYDALAVNVSYFGALLLRFYVANEFKPSGFVYFRTYARYAPVFTLVCLVVFYFFKLYSSRWKYAGLNDMNRILGANAVTLVLHVLGTLLFVMRMPITFYFFGAFFQLVLTSAVRFSYRILIVEKDKYNNLRASVTYNAMVVGTGGTGRMVLKQLERGDNIRPVCALDYTGIGYDSMINGVPAISGIENLKSTVKKYKVNLVIIASGMMPEETRAQVRSLCQEIGVDVQDYSGFFNSVGSRLTLQSLAGYASGTVEIVENGKSRKYTDAEQAILSEPGKNVVKHVYAKNNTLVVELSSDAVILNDLNEDWVIDQEKQTGEAVSFF